MCDPEALILPSELGQKFIPQFSLQGSSFQAFSRQIVHLSSILFTVAATIILSGWGTASATSPEAVFAEKTSSHLTQALDTNQAASINVRFLRTKDVEGESDEERAAFYDVVQQVRGNNFFQKLMRSNSLSAIDKADDSMTELATSAGYTYLRSLLKTIDEDYQFNPTQMKAKLKGFSDTDIPPKVKKMLLGAYIRYWMKAHPEIV
ncbi:unnamed protein product [Phytophthora lilii]|uniref:RxLR effector protein n=1 Tax=Phytophthora lilii TaxID=2077276 RepID=A0A9W6TAZ6_9STRA|nr:unnamed protein product [Phytophthora lilii]